jgi:8-oxo-dGTP pyrophosphatase MutT (NUDIX family)
VLLIKQYRHPVRARDWEIPAGLLDVAHESPLDAAKRELAEEADLVASDWAVLADYFTTPGGSSEAIRIYLARDLADAPEVHARVDEEADMEVRWVPLDACVDAVLERRVGNPSLTIGVLAAQVARSRGWSGLAAADAPWRAHSSQRPAAG